MSMVAGSRPVLIAWAWHLGLALSCSCSGALEYPTTNSCGPINKILILILIVNNHLNVDCNSYVGVHARGSDRKLVCQQSASKKHEAKRSINLLKKDTKNIFSSADPKVSSAELMVLLICPSSVARRRPSSSVIVRRPSVNFCFKSLLLLQFLFDHSEFFTGETRHIVPPCNKAGISNFCLELQKLQKFQIS